MRALVRKDKKKEVKKAPLKERCTKKRLQVTVVAIERSGNQKVAHSITSVKISHVLHIWFCVILSPCTPSTLGKYLNLFPDLCSAAPCCLFSEGPVTVHYLFRKKKKIQFIFQSSSNEDLKLVQ